MKNDLYTLFIDESGGSSLNHNGQFFVLSTVVINKNDYLIIEGYLRMLKRKYFHDDAKIIHMTDLCERPWNSYRKLMYPRKELLKFLKELKTVLCNVPYKVGIYYVNKNIIRQKYNYIPAKGRKTTVVDLEIPYRIASLEAIKDFTNFLVKNKAMGEIVIESRLNNDSNFVRYFDDARKEKIQGVLNPIAKETRTRINSLLFANKRIINGGLELADVGAYISYRKLNGDPKRMMKVSLKTLNSIFSEIGKNAYITDSSGRKLIELKV
ncbi:MAG TPA: DUF3800 domain-containing protein [Candidatus Saccharimonadales bacterium]|nr:DUF3800 domain-containing protein [Candidatus Saccharimonadales bacterium]